MLSNTRENLHIVGNGFIGNSVKNEQFDGLKISSQESGKWNVPKSINENSTVLFLRSISSPSFVQANPEFSNDFNVNKSSKMITEILDNGARVIFTSSDVVYGNNETRVFKEFDSAHPWGLYATQKRLIEEEFLAHPKFTSVRLSLVIGRNCKLISILKLELQPQIPAGVIRNPIKLDSVVTALKELVLEKDHRLYFPNGIVNLGGVRSYDIFDLASELSQKMKLNVPKAIARSQLDVISRPAVVRIDSSSLKNMLLKKNVSLPKEFWTMD